MFQRLLNQRRRDVASVHPSNVTLVSPTDEPGPEKTEPLLSVAFYPFCYRQMPVIYFSQMLGE